MINKVSVSILGREPESAAESVVKSGADMLHFDVMDGKFVENTSYRIPDGTLKDNMGIKVLHRLNEMYDIFMDVHLMIENPKDYIKDFAESGADMITFHIEGNPDVCGTLEEIRKYGIKTGIALKPATSAEQVIPYIEKVDMILVMTVEPGKGGQSFMREMTAKVKEIREYTRQRGLETDIQVDGGINDLTAKECRESGANVFVSGSWFFGRDNAAEAILLLRN